MGGYLKTIEGDPILRNSEAFYDMSREELLEWQY